MLAYVVYVTPALLCGRDTASACCVDGIQPVRLLSQEGEMSESGFVRFMQASFIFSGNYSVMISKYFLNRVEIWPDIISNGR